jgi:hypothetical protein
MRPRKTLCLVALGGFLVQATGCYSIRPLTSELPTLPGGPLSYMTVVVTQETGQKIEVMEPWMDSDWVGGEAELPYSVGVRRTEVRFSLDEVRTIEEKKFSPVKTIVLVGLAMGFSALLPLIVADLFKGPSPGPGPG